MTLSAAILLWLLVSLPFGILLGRFMAVGDR
jgi:hypothetical protein